MARTSLRSRRRLCYGCLLGEVQPLPAGASFLPKILKRKKEICHVTDDHQRDHSVRPRPGTAGGRTGRVSGGRGRRHSGRLPGAAGAIRRRPGGGFWGRADPPVLRGPAPSRAPVSHAGHGHGPAPAGLAECLRLPHGGPVRRHRLRPGDLPPPGPGADRKRHHPGVHVLLPPHGRHADPDGGAGEGGRHRLRGQGEHGPERRPRRAGGDHRGIHAGDAPLAGGEPGFPPGEAHADAPVHPLLHRRADGVSGQAGGGAGSARPVPSVGKPGGDGLGAPAPPGLPAILGDLCQIRPVE